MILGSVLKQPDERLDYDISYVDWIAGGTDQLNNDNVVTVVGEDAALVVTPVQTDAQTVKLWVQGGTPLVTYTVEVTVTTLEGRIKQDELIVIIRDF